MLAFARFNEGAQVITAINMSDEEKNISLPVWAANVPMDCEMQRIMKTVNGRYNVGSIPYVVKDGMLKLRLDPMSCKVLKREQ